MNTNIYGDCQIYISVPWTLWYVGFGFEKYSDYLVGLELILYVGMGLEKYSNYLTVFGLTLSVYDILELDLRSTQR